VTIATNMAGRGTDIALGNPNLGLHVIGTERHSARRIDLQLRGRSGRQGDPGSSRFYLSLQDELFRIFGREEMSAIVKALERSRSGDLERLTRRAQQKSEETSYYIRRYLIERDDVADKQRRAIYRMREEILTGEWTGDRVRSLIANHAADLINCGKYVDEARSVNEWKLDELEAYCMSNFGVHIPASDAEMMVEEIQRTIIKSFEGVYDRRERALGADFSCKLGKAAMIDALETAWTDYLSFQSEFDKSLSLRIYSRSDEMTDYRMESARQFNDLLVSIRREALRDIFTYPLPGERADSIRSAEFYKPVSKSVRELLSVVR